MSARSRKKRKLKAEINVVPYIDVMLVLLIIFMVTAPLLNLGVDVELPQANAKPIQQDKEPVIVALQKDGSLSLQLQGEKPEAIDEVALLVKLSAFVRNNQNVPVFLAGDGALPYEEVMRMMALMQQAGVAKVGLMAQPEAKAN
ncbi:MAG: protein TolR [Chiayiivirga sp.]|jgi:biopolymer transport protein TolR|uniref:protein TolR n=1 Tax=Chiayiivirga sp. TaxID=2041042 RepID=UPI0025C3F3C9|nr:protein TolR [Chiayiivirga sp.]MCI1709005.1 protein TolR [Chiayiivirga sp.]MCI1729379.1 protein TolR [Chiayiivirga sp.]